jgi:hypothetical protein
MAWWTGSGVEPRRALELQKLLQLLKTPYTCREVLGYSLSKIRSSEFCRAWALPATRFVDEVRHYAERHKELKCKGESPTLRKELTEDEALELALKVQAGVTFLKLGRSADPMVRPVLLYYGASHLLGVYARAFFTWEYGRKKKGIGHGMRCRRSEVVGDTHVTVEATGVFPRVVTTLFLLTGMPTPFTELVTYSARPTAHSGPGGLLEHFGNIEEGKVRASLTLDQLATFDYGSELRAVRTRHGFHKYSGLGPTALLVDLLTWYTGSWLARYDVIGWQTILDAKTIPYRIFFDDAYERLVDFTGDALLMHLEDRFLRWDQAVSPIVPNPYSHDHPRFEGDPDSA